jgi:hypothetical protein
MRNIRKRHGLVFLGWAPPRPAEGEVECEGLVEFFAITKNADTQSALIVEVHYFKIRCHTNALNGLVDGLDKYRTLLFLTAAHSSL